MFSYPEGALVATLPVGNALNSSVCTDSVGDVFITDTSSVYEYAHGGSSPIATLSLPGSGAAGCSVDPSSGNLAVVFAAPNGDVAIFSNARGTPVVYISELSSSYCGYDDKGNLFTDGYDGQAYGFSELVNGGDKFAKLSISQSVGQPGQVQWDGAYMTYQGRNKKTAQISRLSITDSTVSVISSTHFKNVFAAAQSWLYEGKVFMPYVRHGNQGHPNRIGIWKYPEGKKPSRNISDFDGYKSRDIQGVAVSART